MKNRITPFLLAALLLSGCAGVQEDASYGDVNDLAQAYGEATDLECHETSNELADHGWLQTTCGPTAVIMMFESDAIRDEIKQKNPLGDGDRWIQGDNWLISARQYEAEKAHEAIGGELLGG